MISHNTFLQQVLATLSEGLFVVDGQGRIVLCNAAFEEMTGYSQEEAVGSTCEILGCDMCLKARALSSKGYWCFMFRHTQRHSVHCTLRRKDGTWLPIVKNGRALYGEDGALYVVETITDMTVLRQKDKKLAELARLLELPQGLAGMVGTSPSMQRVYSILERAATSDAPVLILGESGTGKELAAHAVHVLSGRKDMPYVSINCAALSESVLESELFGHVRGAFTGAIKDREGVFAAAHRGTLFMDEVGDMSLSMQAKLLRVLETGCYQAVGDTALRKTDVRIVSATNRPLEELVRQKKFREDLLFRLRVIPVYLPPLRQRAEDIPLLIQHFIQRMTKNTRHKISLTAEALQRLCSHNWPGNIRELRNTLEYAVVLAGDAPISLEHLPPSSWQTPQSPPVSLCPPVMPTHEDAAQEEQRQAVLEALAVTNWNISKAAQLIGIHRSTLHTRMLRLRIERPKRT